MTRRSEAHVVFQAKKGMVSVAELAQQRAEVLEDRHEMSMFGSLFMNPFFGGNPFFFHRPFTSPTFFNPTFVPTFPSAGFSSPFFSPFFFNREFGEEFLEHSDFDDFFNH